MLKKIIILLLLSVTASVAYAEDYLYVENPDPDKYIVIWLGPNPNCIENSDGYKTYGWIRHQDGEKVFVKIALKDFTYACQVEIDDSIYSPIIDATNCAAINTKNTHWVTVQNYKIHKTWACG